jgi:membrane protein DedA with SNARE-associated domain
VVLPLAAASAIWYGALVWAGTIAGKNVDRILAMVGELNVWLLAVALAVVGAAFTWWWRTRHHG